MDGKRRSGKYNSRDIVDDTIKSNIRHLREAFGESQQNLADYVGLSKQDIYNIEKGNRGITQETLDKIASHYYATANQLKYGDFSYFEKNELKDLFLMNSKELAFGLSSIVPVIYPIVHSKKAFSNKYFKKAYELHSKLYLEKLNNPYAPINFENIYSFYDKAIQDDVIEACVNQLSLLALIFDTLISDLSEDIKNVFNESLSDSQIHLNQIQESVFEIGESEEGNKLRINFLNEYEQDIYCLMTRVQKSKKYYQYAYYFNALRHYMVMIDKSETNLPPYLERELGLLMMEDLVAIGNKYAILWDSVYEINEEE